VVSVRQAKPLAAATEVREPHVRVAPSFFIGGEPRKVHKETSRVDQPIDEDMGYGRVTGEKQRFEGVSATGALRKSGVTSLITWTSECSSG